MHSNRRNPKCDCSTCSTYCSTYTSGIFIRKHIIIAAASFTAATTQNQDDVTQQTIPGVCTQDIISAYKMIIIIMQLLSTHRLCNRNSPTCDRNTFRYRSSWIQEIFLVLLFTESTTTIVVAQPIIPGLCVIDALFSPYYYKKRLSIQSCLFFH